MGEVIMRARLFKDDSESWTINGIEFSEEIHKAIKQIVTKYKDANFSLRDMELIAMNTVSLHMLEETMSERSKMRNLVEQERLNKFKHGFDIHNLRNEIIAQALKDGIGNCTGGLIPLIKACRTLINCSLKDAKFYVEDHFPELKDNYKFPFVKN